MPSALILGATGQVGQYVLRELLSSSHFTRVGEYGRRVTNQDSITTRKDRLEQKTIDFDNIDQAGLKDGEWDVVFITLGTTRSAAGSAETFERIDREYVLNAARAARTHDPNHLQRVVYVSVSKANPSSPFLYLKSKGLTELGLAKLGYNDTLILRPGVFRETNRSEPRLLENILGVLSYVSNNFAINISTLAKSIVEAGIVGSSGLPKVAEATTEGPTDGRFTAISNAGAIAMATKD